MTDIPSEQRLVLAVLADGGEFSIVNDRWFAGGFWGEHDGIKGGHVYWRSPQHVRCTRRMAKALERAGYIAQTRNVYRITDKGRALLGKDA
jgi:hypothetical protein